MPKRFRIGSLLVIQDVYIRRTRGSVDVDYEVFHDQPKGGLKEGLKFARASIGFRWVSSG